MFTLPVLSQIVLNGITLSAIYILVALGFTLIFGIMRIVNFAHGEFAMLGGFALLFFYSVLKLHFFIATARGGDGWLGFSRSREACLSPLLSAGDAGMIASLGVSITLMYGAVALWAPIQRSIPGAFSSVYNIGPVFITAERLAVIGVCVASLLLFYVVLKYTRMGLAMRVIAEDRVTAKLKASTRLRFTATHSSSQRRWRRWQAG